ncbi:MAG: hypothetical protein HYY37_00380 [Candidatus Aenigmarchaeota archaeon]|nr:hypothetical protein [Candidatus Aenigmarchaeota archaeon]
MDINPEKFHRSISKELKVIQDRVRNLMGSAHWGEEGRYKEAVLRSIIRRFLPKNVSIGTGFILKKEGDEIKISNQIDIIIYDNTYPVLFAEGDFLITTPANVKGIIEVKTKLNSSDVMDVVSKATNNGKVVDNEIFSGVFVYNEGNIVNNSNISDNLKSALKESKGVVNHICLGEDIFIKFWPRNPQSNFPNKYSIYRIKDLSFSYFISNLAEQTSESKLKERWWFLYPIEKGKEEYKIEDIDV